MKPDPYTTAQRDLEAKALRGPGKTSQSLREAVFERKDVPAELLELVEKVETGAYNVTDEDIARLKSKYSEDELFEIVITTILGASKRRLDAGLKALEDA